MGRGPGSPLVSRSPPSPHALRSLTVRAAVEAQPQADLAPRVPGQGHDADVTCGEVVVQVVAHHGRLVHVPEEGLRREERRGEE